MKAKPPAPAPAPAIPAPSLPAPAPAMPASSLAALPTEQMLVVNPRELLSELTDAKVREARLQERLFVQQELADEKVARARAEGRAEVLQQVLDQQQQARLALPGSAQREVLAIQDAVKEEAENLDEQAGVHRLTVEAGTPLPTTCAEASCQMRTSGDSSNRPRAGEIWTG